MPSRRRATCGRCFPFQRPMADPARPFNLVQWFSLLSLGTLAVTAVVTAVLLTKFIEDRLLAFDAETARDFVESVARAEGAELLAFDTSAAGPIPAGLAEYFSHVSQMPEVVRTNVYGRDRSVLWSSDRAMVGRRFPDNDELDDALAGAVVYKRGYIGNNAYADHKPEHYALPAGAFFIESYIPIYATGSERPVAVVELYKAARKLEETLRAAQWLVWGATAAGGVALFLVLQGIVRRAAAQIAAQQERLVEAETMAAVGVMGSAVAHGIRNPLASIRSSAELAADAPDCTWREQAEDVIGAADRIESAIRDLLSYSQPSGWSRAPVSINRIAAESIEAQRREIERKGGAARIDLDPADPLVVADPAMLRQVFSSLLVNGVEAIGAGGSVAIATALDGGRQQVRVEVRDTGHGIPANELSNVLRPFFTTKPKGLGLGLPLAKRIVERLGGTLAVRSAVGAGTTVELTLPVAS